MADFILILHFAIVLFITGGLLAIWLGGVFGWPWVRNFKFRLTHVFAMVVITLESVFGVVCPLTAWEQSLRGESYQDSFLKHWIHKIMFYSAPEWVFTMAYLAFLAAMIGTWFLVRPKRSVNPP